MLKSLYLIQLKLIKTFKKKKNDNENGKIYSFETKSKSLISKINYRISNGICNSKVI